jgi:hypothetical protein
MGNEVLKIDANYKGVAAGVTDDANEDITIFRLNPVTKRLLVDATVILGAGVDIISFPAGNLGMQLMAHSLSITPASNITDATYIGDIKFGESLPTGSNIIGAVTQSGIWNIGTLTSITNAISANCTQTTSPWVVSGSVNANCSGTVSANCTQTTSPWVISGNVTSNSANIATETTLSAINTKLVSGTDIGDVTINNANGAAAVNIQDGGNTITVDGTVTANQGGSPWQVQSNSANISTEATLKGVAGLVLTTYDYIALTYTGTNLTGVVFKTGGAGGSTVSTLTLAYTGSRLDTVTKT